MVQYYYTALDCTALTRTELQGSVIHPTALTLPDMENVNSFTLADFFNPKFYLQVRKLRKKENCHKRQIMKIIIK